MQTWQLHDAKDSLSKVIDKAQREGPQIITRHGVEVAVVISCDQFCQDSTKHQKLSAFFAESPLAEVELEFERDSSLIRSISS